MISLELAHFIAKFYVLLFFICFLVSFSNKGFNKSNLIIVSFALIHSILGQSGKVAFDFYTYYLACACFCIFVIASSMLTHIYLRIKHEAVTVIIYSLYIFICISYLIIHRVRVIVYDTDEPILWLINSQSVFTLGLYFISISLLLYGCNIQWKSQFGRLSSLF